MYVKMWSWVKVLTIAAIVAGLSAGCSASSESRSDGGASADTANTATADMALTSESAPASTEEKPSMESEQPASEESVIGSESNAGSGTSVAPTVQQARANRMLIYTANITMEVENYGNAYTEIQNLIHLSEGYIVGFTEETTQFEKTGLFTIKVPAGGFDGFLTKLEKIPNLQINRSLKAQDVSEEYVDLDARLKARQVVEKRLLGFMEKASRTDDLVTFSNELARVQEEIERMKGRMRYLEQNVAYSTVELRMYQKMEQGVAVMEVGKDVSLGEKMGKAIQSSLNVLVIVFEGVMVVIAGLIPIAAAACILGIPAYWIWKRRGSRTRTKETPPNDL